MTAAAIVALLSACGEQETGSRPDSGIRGVVTSGPQCPVASIENPCPDRAVPGIAVQVRSRDGSVQQVRTDGAGRFTVALLPGSYVVQPRVETSGVAFAKPVEVAVSPGQFTEVGLIVDTGIR